MRPLTASAVACVGPALALALGAPSVAKPKAAAAPPPKPAAAPAAPAPAPAPAAPGPAAPGAMMGFNSNAPIDATADTMEQFRDQHLTIMRGNVEIIQGDVRIRTPELKLYSEDKGGPPAAGAAAPIGPSGGMGAIDHLEAAGPVYYMTPTQQARADHAFYEKVADTITLTGNVVVTQDKNVVTGDKLIVEQKTGHSTLITNSPGLNKPKRVRGVFYPQEQQPGAPGAASATPSLGLPTSVKPAKKSPPPPASAPKKV